MANNVKIHATLKDDVSQPVKGIRGSLANLGTDAKASILTGVGLGAGVTAFNALSNVAGKAIDFLGDAVRAAREETVSVALMTTALRENSAAFDGNLDAIEKVIKERMALGFTDDEQRTSLGQLTSVTKDHNAALELQRTAMDLSRLKGMGLEAATTLLGKVYAGNLGILSRYGIVLEKGATATDAIAEIQRRAAGQAEAWAETEEGAAQTASIAFAELQEQIGAKLLPVLTELAKFARDTLVPALSAVVDNADNIGKAIGAVTGGFLGALQGMQGWVEKEKAALEAETAAIVAEKAKQQAAIDEQGKAWEARYRQMHGPIADAAGDLAAIPAGKLRESYQDIRAAAYQQTVEYAKGLLDAQNEPMVAMDALLQMQEEELTKAAEIARLQGQLTSINLAAGLNDGREGVSSAARATKQAIIDRLLELGAYSWGLAIDSELARGIDAGLGVVRGAAGRLAYAVRGQIGINSEPSDPTSPLRGITKWGGNIARELSSGMLAGFGGTRAAAGGLAGGVASGSSGGGTQIIQLVVGARVLAEIVNQENRHLLPASSVMPR